MEKKKITTTKQVMIFGVFDGAHAGHSFFISKAEKLGDVLYIVVAPDTYVKKNKNKKPIHTLAIRKKMLKKLFPKAKIISGDTTLGTWSAIKKYKPNIIAYGHDQQALHKALSVEKSRFPSIKKIIKIKSFKKKTLNSSSLFKNLTKTK